jgi:mono/diheme cytochrome c family protein
MKRLLLLLILLAAFAFMSACNQNDQTSKYDHLDQRTKIRLRQYLSEGKRLYEIYCANCHQKDGNGLARLYPPLKNSDYMVLNKDKVICGIRYGQQGEIMVNGVLFNQPMPANLSITDLEIAEIATYIYSEFADSVQIITINDVKKIMESCSKDTVSVENPALIKNP